MEYNHTVNSELGIGRKKTWNRDQKAPESTKHGVCVGEADRKMLVI